MEGVKLERTAVAAPGGVVTQKMIRAGPVGDVGGKEKVRWGRKIVLKPQGGFFGARSLAKGVERGGKSSGGMLGCGIGFVGEKKKTRQAGVRLKPTKAQKICVSHGGRRRREESGWGPDRGTRREEG